VTAKLTGRQGCRELRWLVDQKPDLVCVSGGGNLDGLPLLELCHQQRIPYASIIQANAEYFWPRDDQAESMLPVYRDARRAFFVSHMNRQLFENQLALTLSNAEVVWNPTNVRWDATPAWPAESAGWKLACVGRLEPNAKGQDLLLQALALEAWKSRPMALSLIGSGPMEHGLRRLVTKLGLDERVRFVGHVGDIEQVWAEHHALVLASRYEGLPLVLVEAMLCRRPAIITEVAGDGRMVEEGVTGFVARAPTVPLVAEALERAWERRAQWQEMGRAARQRVEKLVPKDPIGHFCERLLSCVRS
jgi:glycosyltransferase involved in cell wall biosynthesis